MTAYYNEIDPFAAEWLRNLIAAGHIAAGDVDERSWDSRPSGTIARLRKRHRRANGASLHRKRDGG